jgi:hypothetical protein
MGDEHENCRLNSGSRWNRWEPHIHAPGTVLNDQFRGADTWEKYLKALEYAAPVIRAIGITDYYSTETYERVCEAKLSGRLPNCDLIFPNVEMRLGIGTVKGKWVNLHLLVSPEDPDRITELKRFLNRLTFNAYGDSFSCNKGDLIRLGHWSDPNLADPEAELERGTEQFKVSFDQLKQVYSESTDCGSWERDGRHFRCARSCRRDAPPGNREVRARNFCWQFSAARFLARSAQGNRGRTSAAIWRAKTMHAW